MYPKIYIDSAKQIFIYKKWGNLISGNRKERKAQWQNMNFDTKATRPCRPFYEYCWIISDIARIMGNN